MEAKEFRRKNRHLEITRGRGTIKKSIKIEDPSLENGDEEESDE